jgi:hypothetical protein
MRIKTSVAALASILAASTMISAPAQAGGDAVVAGALGFGVGALFGSAVSAPRYVSPGPVYLAPEPVYIAPEPVYVEPPVVYRSAPVYYARPWTAEWYESCGARYRSFDPRDGSYLGVDGRRYMCR